MQRSHHVFRPYMELNVTFVVAKVNITYFHVSTSSPFGLPTLWIMAQHYAGERRYKSNKQDKRVKSARNGVTPGTSAPDAIVIIISNFALLTSVLFIYVHIYLTCHTSQLSEAPTHLQRFVLAFQCPLDRLWGRVCQYLRAINQEDSSNKGILLLDMVHTLRSLCHSQMPALSFMQSSYIILSPNICEWSS